MRDGFADRFAVTFWAKSQWLLHRTLTLNPATDAFIPFILAVSMSVMARARSPRQCQQRRANFLFQFPLDAGPARQRRIHGDTTAFEE
ncbi:hypothetical protein VP03_30730 [Sinorhizobium meliloti]|nr:hypothetical protein VP03_30730 [Sinorhizobium meliloti]